MAFFPRHFYNNTTNEASFTPLFRLLDDFDSYSRQGGSPQCRRSNVAPSWQPKFDVREVSDAYELYGELPGVNKENVHIEFTEPQTMTVRGKTERIYTAGTPPAGNHVEDTTMSGAITEAAEQEKPVAAATPKHQATVEDEDISEDTDSGFEAVEKPRDDADAATPQASPKLTAQVQAAEQKQQQKPADKAKYWLTERSVGGFSRSFNFPSRVEQDEVSASFNDGILTVRVPKAKKHESRRITVN